MQKKITPNFGRLGGSVFMSQRSYYVGPTQMRHVVADGVGWSVCLSVRRYVGLSVTIVSPAKTAEPIEMPFGSGLGWAQGTAYWMGIDPSGEGTILRERAAHCKV